MILRHYRPRSAHLPAPVFVIAVSSCLLLMATLSASDPPWAANGMFSSPFGIGGCQAAWGDLEPEEGKWHWDKFNKYLIQSVTVTERAR